ncbi:hypothetical protein [Tenacibaculum piscium]|uniref:hypothetical protein n=1 Tax=Tenacibaculum piscium TaxID=1458515 RepID=UPI001F1DCFD3|nr:hypothetical protein [Tenacibaculum piscium]
MISEARLLELGFKPQYKPTDENNVRINDQFEYDKGNVLIGRCKDEFYIHIYPPITSSLDYSPKVEGVKNEEDLIKLCELVNGKY